jgi:hypothetical protein
MPQARIGQKERPRSDGAFEAGGLQVLGTIGIIGTVIAGHDTAVTNRALVQWSKNKPKRSRPGMNITRNPIATCFTGYPYAICVAAGGNVAIRQPMKIFEHKATLARTQWAAAGCASQLAFVPGHGRLDAHKLVVGPTRRARKRCCFVHGTARKLPSRKALWPQGLGGVKASPRFRYARPHVMTLCDRRSIPKKFREATGQGWRPWAANRKDPSSSAKSGPHR